MSYFKHKPKEPHTKRLSGYKRKQNLEEVNLIESKTKAFKNYEKVKKIFDFKLKGVDIERQKDDSEITSPHFYKPHKKLFYIPQSNQIKKSISKNRKKSKDVNLLRESHTQGRQYILTEVNSPLQQLDFEVTNSPDYRQNLRFLSTKNTTDENEEINNLNILGNVSKSLIKGNQDLIGVKELHKIDSINLRNQEQNNIELGSRIIQTKDSTDTLKKISKNSNQSQQKNQTEKS